MSEVLTASLSFFFPCEWVETFFISSWLQQLDYPSRFCQVGFYEPYVKGLRAVFVCTNSSS